MAERDGRLDRPTVLVAGLLAALGFAFFWSATWRADRGLHVPSPWPQLGWIAAAALGAALVTRLDYRVLGRWAAAIYAGGLALLLLTELFGTTINGARRWLGAGRLTVQPSEWMKVAATLALARLIAARPPARRLRDLALPIATALAPVLFLLRQPDLGTAILFLPIPFALLFTAGARPGTLLKALAALLLLPAAVYLASPQAIRDRLLRPYQRERLLTWWDAERARSRPEGYQLWHAEIALGSGGIAGKGLRQGPQNVYGFLPAKSSDFIFSVVGEEGGFAACATILLLFLALGGCYLRAAARTREPLGRLLAAGAATLLLSQVFLNTGVATGLLPTTGVPLPFVSGGGSGMLAQGALLGLVLSVGMRRGYVLSRDRRSGEG